MDKKTTIRIVGEYINFLKQQKYEIKKAYIFGSYANGSYNEDSDIDIAVVMEKMDDRFDTSVYINVLGHLNLILLFLPEVCP